MHINFNESVKLRLSTTSETISLLVDIFYDMQYANTRTVVFNWLIFWNLTG